MLFRSVLHRQRCGSGPARPAFPSGARPPSVPGLAAKVPAPLRTTRPARGPARAWHLRPTAPRLGPAGTFRGALGNPAGWSSLSPRSLSWAWGTTQAQTVTPDTQRERRRVGVARPKDSTSAPGAGGPGHRGNEMLRLMAASSIHSGGGGRPAASAHRTSLRPSASTARTFCRM